MTSTDLISRLKSIRAEVGYSAFDVAIKLINRERLGTQIEKRKPMSRKLKLELYARQNGCCARCGDPFLINESSDDHTVPISKGGTNQKWNRRLVHKSCNSSKGDNMPLEESKKTGQTVLDQIGGKPNV